MDLLDVKRVQLRREAFIEEESRCCICGTDLSFQHRIDQIQVTITEVASCPVCGIRNKTKTHTIH